MKIAIEIEVPRPAACKFRRNGVCMVHAHHTTDPSCINDDEFPVECPLRGVEEYFTKMIYGMIGGSE